MNNIFKNANSLWVKYDKYEWKKDNEGTLFLTPASHAGIKLYNPMKDYEEMILDALDVGILCMRKKSNEETVMNSILTFTEKYGMLGLISSIPAMSDFINYEYVYLPKNHYIKKESLSTEKYLSYFFPFEKLDFVKNKLESSWSVSGAEMTALFLTLNHLPEPVLMSFQKEYSERYDWIRNAFTDMAFTFFSAFLYYQDKDTFDDNQLSLYQKGMAAFGGIAPTYHIELRDKPVIVWEFYSLLLQLQTMLSLMITDEQSSLKVCKNCGKAYLSKDFNNPFCSKECEDEYGDRH
ncbi:MAG: hypothetical protein K6G64_03010 [Eubacterium sp.]|nr:hypothetical protein [Eubacterium sp.]